MADASSRGVYRDLVSDGMCGAGHSINGPADVETDADGVQRCRRCLAEMGAERRRILDVGSGGRPRR